MNLKRLRNIQQQIVSTVIQKIFQSAKMQEDQEQTRKEQMRKQLINQTTDKSGISGNSIRLQEEPKANKIVKMVCIGSAIVIALALIISLPIVLTKEDPKTYHSYVAWAPPPPSPQPNAPPAPPLPVDPLAYQEFNPYKLASMDEQDWYTDIIIHQNHSVMAPDLPTLTNGQAPSQWRTYMPVNPQQIGEGANNRWAQNVSVQINLINNYQAQLIMGSVDNNANRYRVSDKAFSRQPISWESRLSQMGYQMSTQPFGFNFSNIYTRETLFSTQCRKLTVTDYFSEIGFVLPTNRIFGLGQRNSQLQLKNGTYTLYSRGRQMGIPKDNGEGGLDGPHMHPFILGQTKHKEDFYGMFFASSSPMAFEVIYFQDHDEIVMNYIQLGGDVEIYFFMRKSAEAIVQLYHSLIGNSQVPPYYALGFFQGSNAYKNQSQVEDMISSYATNNFPLEGVMIDTISQPNNLFTVDGSNWPSISSLLEKMQQEGQHLIVGLDSGYINDPASVFYQLLNTTYCVLNSSLTGKFLVGQQNKEVIFPDYQCPNINEFYDAGLQNLNSLIHFDGLTLLNNQFYTFSSGEKSSQSNLENIQLLSLMSLQTNVRAESQQNEETSGNWNGSYLINPDQSMVSMNNLPFVPGYYWSGNLNNHTISLDAVHQGGLKELYLHNINGHMSAKVVHNATKNSTWWQYKGTRPMIFSESTWSGSGAFAGIILKDLWRDWSNLRSTISMAISMSMYGISNTMASICGDLGNLDWELCGRWAQLGAFLPMVRNFYNETYISDAGFLAVTRPTEFYLFDDENMFMAGAALDQRMAYTRYIYSQMYKVYYMGGSLVRPLFFDYPNDDECFEDIEHTYMLGDSIKVSPVLEKGVTDKYSAYFPAGKWADLNIYNRSVVSTGEYVNLNQSVAFTNIHLKEGKIIPFQQNTGQYKTTSDFLTKLKMSFIINRDASEYADGYILIDDGKSATAFENIEFTFWKIRYAEKSINFWVEWGNFNYSVPEGMTIDTLQDIQILHAQDLANTDFACFLGLGLTPTSIDFDYNPWTQILTLKPLQDLRFKDIGFIKFGNSKQEPNFCNYETAFTYQVNAVNQVNDQLLHLNISSKQGIELLEELVVSIWLMDDFGTINLNITSTTDFNSGDSLFKPDHVTDFSFFQAQRPTKKLSAFFEYTSDPFSYKIYLEDDTTEVIYQSDPHKLYFSKYMIFDSGIFSMNAANNFPLMGMGERAGSLFYKNENGGIHSRYSFDQANPIDDGMPPGRNMYGYQPYYSFQSSAKGTPFVGVFDLSSYATDYVLYYNGGVNTQITKILIGGIIQKYFFVGAKPDVIITRYERLVGMPTVPPFWAFGWQQCRFGWKTDQEWYQVLQNYTAADLPLDTMWADIDYMDDYKIFTISEQRYSHLAGYVRQIREAGLTFVPIMDVGVAVRKDEGYQAYDRGMTNDVFIKQYDGSAPLTAGVWPGNAYFPDFTNPNTTPWWHSMFDYLKTNYNLEFDGIWIDMNEATNFCNGYCNVTERPTDSLRNKPFYVPGWRDLEDKSLGVDGLHYNGWNEYDMHSMFSLTQVKATNEYLEKQNLRPYVLSRSNFPGLGKYGYHWLGDNWSTVEYMKVSVDGMYEYQLFGMPFMGSDICGFNGDAAPDLCTRYHQLGSLYPFSRNHNQNASAPQEPYRFTQIYQLLPRITYTDIIRTALRNRYSFIYYYYSNFWDIYHNGGSFFKPMFFEWPNDPLTYEDIEINILLGKALKASIQVTTLEEGDTAFYFPEGAWCQVLPKIDGRECFESKGNERTGNKTMQTHMQDYYVHIRGGYMIPYIDSIGHHINKTKDMLKLPTDYVILPLAQNEPMTSGTITLDAIASGFIYFDDGISKIGVPTRFDMFLTKNDTTGVIANLLIVNSIRGDQHDGTFSQIGKLMIMSAKTSGLDAVTQVIATVGTQAIPIPTFTYTRLSDELVIDISGQSLAFSLYNTSMIEFRSD